MTSQENKGCCPRCGEDDWEGWTRCCNKGCKCHKPLPPNETSEWGEWKRELLEFWFRQDKPGYARRPTFEEIIPFIAATIEKEKTAALLRQKASIGEAIRRKKEVYDDDVNVRNDKYRIEGRNKVIDDILAELGIERV